MRLPQEIGPWRLTQRLGHGAFGSVYLAEVQGDAGFTSRVAVKLLDSGAIEANPTIGQSLIDEAKLLSRLQHPGIVRVLDLQHVSHEFLGETYAMAMEYVEGITLSALLENVGLQASSLTIPAILSLFSEITAALEYAHNHLGDDGAPSLIVHRDLKPANLIVTPEGHVKVLDFGIAWASERGVEATREGMTKGTLPYMSPEQVHGLEVDGRSDPYALGTIVFEMLTGEPFVGFYPFGQSDIARMVKRVAELHFEERRPLLVETLQGGPHFLDELQSQSLELLLAKLLARNPDERFSSARELMEELEALYVFWRPEVGRRELGGHMDLWYAEHPRDPGPQTVPYKFSAQDSGESRKAPKPDSGSSAAGMRSEHALPIKEPLELDGKATLPQEVPALSSAETMEVPSSGAPSSDRERGGLAENTTRFLDPPPSSSSGSPQPEDTGLEIQFEVQDTEEGEAPESISAPQGEPSSSIEVAPGRQPVPRPRTNPALQSLASVLNRGARTGERMPDSERFRRNLLLLFLFGALVLALAAGQGDDSDTPAAPNQVADTEPTTAIAPTPIADVRITGERNPSEARTTVSFVDSRGAVILAPVLPGLKDSDGLALIRGEDGWLDFALVGTRAYESARGVLILWDLRGPAPSEVWRIDDFFEETPEVDIGVHGATSYGFGGVDFLPGEADPPHVLAIAHDRNFAPTWLLRIDSGGEVLGRRYHPGHLSTVIALDRFNIVVRGVSNRLCPSGEVPCDQEEVVWIVSPPGASERTEFLPGCGGTPTISSGRGYSWPQKKFRIRSVMTNTSERGGFELILQRQARPTKEECKARLEFGDDGEFRGQYSDCGFEAPIYEVARDAGMICLEWEKLGNELR